MNEFDWGDNVTLRRSTKLVIEVANKIVPRFLLRQIVRDLVIVGIEAIAEVIH